MIKKINSLTKIFLKDYFEKINSQKDNNKKTFSLILLIFIFCLIYVSYNIIDYLQKTNEPWIFLKIYLPIFAIIMIFQLILITVNILFYSKDIEYIIPMPINPIELLLAKLNTIIVIMYILEIFFLVIPLFIFGIYVVGTINYFVTGIISLLIFPILYVLIIAILSSVMMKFSKIIKNQNLLQILIIVFLTIILVFFIMNIYKNVFLQRYEEDFSKLEILDIKMQKTNKYFIQINSIIQILQSKNYMYILGAFLKISLINIILFFCFVLINRKTYYLNILQNLNKIKNKRQYKYKKYNYKKSKKEKRYLKNEFKKIIQDLTYFNQGIYQYICIVIVIMFIINLFIPIILNEFREENIIEEMGIEQFQLQATFLILAIIQLCFYFNNLSITAISRDGKEATVIKYIPMSLYKQFILKNMPQVFINIFIIIGILTVIFNNIENVSTYYYIIMFILAMIMNIVDSEIMLLIDCNKPNLNWINKESVMKSSKKKIYKFVYTILIFIIFKYFTKFLQDFKYGISIIFISTIFILITIFLNIYIYKNINKIFEKIY